MSSPKAVVQVGHPRDDGCVRWSDMIVSTEGAQGGAVLIEWNLATTSEKSSGMWDVQIRIGGFAGSKLGLAECSADIPTNSTNSTSQASPTGGVPSGYSAQPVPTPSGAPTPYANSTSSNSSHINPACIGAFASMHITPSASGLYLENTWFWTADHDLDSLFKNITVYSGRGLLVSSTAGRIWMYGTSVEHHALYQYQFAGTKDIVAGQIQTETAYYQPGPNPLKPVAGWWDPEGRRDGWALHILDSEDIAIYGAGLYSFYDAYNVSCSFDKVVGCQSSIASIERSKNINIYNLNTLGADSMIDGDGKSMPKGRDNQDVFLDTVALFKSG